MKSFSDDEITELHSVLTDESDRDYHEPSRKDAADRQIVSDLLRKVTDEATERRLWWA